MRGHVPTYQLVSPGELTEALSMLAGEPGVWQPFAGGTDLMVLLESGRLPHKNYLNIWNLAELRGIEVSESHVTLGSLTTYTDVQSNKVLQEEFPMLCQAASETGGLAIQNRGTLGGNIVNASPAADSPPALLAYNAELELLSVHGSRWVLTRVSHGTSNDQAARWRLALIVARLCPDMYLTTQGGTRKAQRYKVCRAATRGLRWPLDHFESRWKCLTDSSSLSQT